MSNEVAKPMRELDGFDDYNKDVEDSQTSSIIQGERIKFGDSSRPTAWLFARSGEPIPPNPVVAFDSQRLEQQWPPTGSDDPPKTRVLAPDEKFRDVEMLNASTPEAEWRIGPDGKPKGPYENAYALYLLNMHGETVERFTYIASTTGGMRAVRELREQVDFARKRYGKHCYALVLLTDTFMPTRYGGRQRPHFKIQKWVMLGGEGDGGKVPPTPDAPKLQGPQEVKPPSASEVLDDEVPW